MNTIKEKRIEFLRTLNQAGLLTAELIISMNYASDDDIDLSQVDLSPADIDRLTRTSY